MTEKQIEDVFEVFHEKLIEKGLVFQSRQFSLESGQRVDLLFKDVNNKNVVVELKKDAITREDVGQTLQYAGLIKNSRVILAAPIISSSIKTAFEHYGIEYIEFSITEIEKLYDKIKDKKISVNQIQNIEIPLQIIAEPLHNKRLQDGNIAFKVTFNDRNWNGVCSPDVAEYNFKHRTWCGIQSKFKDNCQHKMYSHFTKMNSLSDNFPCHDSIALKDLFFYAGHFHGEKHNNEPKRCLHAKVNKIALFTSRKNGEPENERFVFAIGQIHYIETVTDERGDFEYFHCDKSSALIFNKDNYPQYWKYYRNANNPDRIAWNTGLFRYLSDKVVRSVLEDIVGSVKYTKNIKEKASNLLKLVE